MPIPAPEPLGPLIRRLRLRAGLSQDGLADRSGVSARAISDLERGQRASARFETVGLLADALALSTEDRTQLIWAAQSPLIDITLRLPVAAPLVRRALPAPQTALVGRAREVAELAGELTAGPARLVPLTGPGGVGKTRLALAAAASAEAGFPGGVAWIDLSPVVDPDAVVVAISHGLGIIESTTQSLIDGLRNLVGEQRFLLVLDNFEQVIVAAPAVSALLAAAPSLTVLVTSRSPLRVLAEIEYPVAPLALPAPDTTTRDVRDIESVRLFVERARAVQRDFVLTPENGEVVTRICRRLDGLPLAIELAASWVNVLPPRGLLERLEQRLPLLSRAACDAPLRQQTMSNTIAWSYHLLDPDSQWLFRLLSVFVGGFTVDTVEWAMGSRGSNGVAAIDTLAALVESSLVFRVPDSSDAARFTMFETIREYGIAQLIARQELREAHHLLASYCRGLSRYGDGIPTCVVPAPWLVMVDQERGNIRAAYRYLARSHDPERLLEFTAAFGHYLYLRGPLQEAWAWFERALDAAAPQSTPLRLQGLYWGSHLASHMKLTERAIRLGDEALRIAEELGDSSWRAATIHCLAVIHDGCGQFGHAAALFEEELRLWNEAGVRGLSGFALMFLGSYAFEQGDLAKARRLEEQAAVIFDEMGGLGWVAKTTWLRGLFAVSDGDLPDAATSFLESLRISLSQQTSMIHDKGLVGLAFVASELSCHETAGQLIGATESCLETTGQHFGRHERSLYDRAIATSQSAIGTTAFNAARELGGASGYVEWLRSGEAIARAAVDRPLRPPSW